MAAVGNEEVETTPSLEGLANKWNEDAGLRTLLLHSGSLLQWPCPEQRGVVNFDTMRLNAAVLNHVLELWAPQVEAPKTVCIDAVRSEVDKLRTKLALPLDVVKVNCDASSIKSMVTYVVKRHDGSRRRDPIINMIFELVSKHWPVMTKKTQPLSDQYGGEATENPFETTPPGENDVFLAVAEAEANAVQAEPAVAYELGALPDDPMGDANVMAEPVEPPNDSQVLDDTFVQSDLYPEFYEPSSQVVPSDVGEPTPPVVPSDGPSESPVNGPVVNLAPGKSNSSIASTELELDTSPSPEKHHEMDKKEVICVPESPEVTKTPPKESLQDVRERIKDIENRLALAKCARPLQSSNVPAGPVQNVDPNAETLPLDLSPFAKAYVEPASHEEVPLDDGVATLKRCPPVPSSSDPQILEEKTGTITVDETEKPLPAPDTVPTPKPAESLFHSTDVIARTDQMEERDRMKKDKHLKAEAEAEDPQGEEAGDGQVKKPKAKGKAKAKGKSAQAKAKSKPRAKAKARVRKAKDKGQQKGNTEDAETIAKKPRATAGKKQTPEEQQAAKAAKDEERRKAKELKAEEKRKAKEDAKATKDEEKRKAKEDAKAAKDEEKRKAKELKADEKRKAKEDAKAAKDEEKRKAKDMQEQGKKKAKKAKVTTDGAGDGAEAGGTPPGKEKGEKATFARRNRPQRGEAAKRWDSLKITFNTRVAPMFEKPSSLEDPFWAHCVQMQKDSSHQISNFDHFFEGCVESFFMIEGVRRLMIDSAE